MAHRDRNISMIRGAGLLALFAVLLTIGTDRLARADFEGSLTPTGSSKSGTASSSGTSGASNTEDKEKAASKKKDGKANEKAGEAKPQLNRRDPFVVPARIKFEPPKVEIKKEPKPISPPGMETRLTEYRNLVRAASLNGQAAPDKLKLSPYLSEDFTVTGIFRDSAGYGAFLLAGPTKLTLFARVGMQTYDGVIKEITPTGVRFVKNIRYDDGSVRQTEEFRALRSGK